jgi:hypothetical protein
LLVPQQTHLQIGKYPHGSSSEVVNEQSEIDLVSSVPHDRPSCGAHAAGLSGGVNFGRRCTD